MATMKTKSVGFNIESEEDLVALQYASEKGNFSGYVKSLILADLKRNPSVIKTEGKGVSIRIT